MAEVHAARAMRPGFDSQDPHKGLENDQSGRVRTSDPKSFLFSSLVFLFRESLGGSAWLL